MASLTISAALDIVSTYHLLVGARCPSSFEPGFGDHTKGTILAPKPASSLTPCKNVSLGLSAHNEDAVNIAFAENFNGVANGFYERLMAYAV